jgi:hypothetical protein
MTPLFPARAFPGRRRAEEFAAAVDGEASSADGRRSAELAELLGVVTALREHPEAQPRAEFAGALRSRLMTEAETTLRPQNATLLLPVRPRGARERRLMAAASAVVLIGGTTTMAAAAQNALPGEALYPIKRGIEQAEASLSLNAARKGSDLLDQARGRLTEVQGLLAADSPQSMPQVAGTLGDFSAQAAEGSDLLLTSFEESRDPSSVVEVRTFAADAIEVLEGLADEVPSEAQHELAVAAGTLRDIDARAVALCRSCAQELPALEVPGLILSRSEVDRALSTVSTSALDNSHPVIVPKGTTSKSQRSGPTDTSAEGTEDEPVSDPTAVDSPDDLDPGDVRSPALPGSEEKVSGGDNVTETSKDAVQDLSDGLSGAVDTLLPDADGDQLLP